MAIDFDGCPGEIAAVRDTRERPLDHQDLVVQHLGDHRRLVWVMTDHFSDGQAQGPVALVEIDRSLVAVRALGVLRAYPRNVSLRLEQFRGGLALIADAARCDANQALDRCSRSVRIVPLIGDAFVPKTVINDKGACLGSSTVYLRAGGTIAGGARRGMAFNLTGSVSLTPDGVSVREELAVERRTGGGQADGAYVMRQQAERQIRLEGGNLISDGPSLLSRWLERREVVEAPERDRERERDLDR